VPEELVAVRTKESFRMRAAEHVEDTIVADVGGSVAGFTMIVDDEVEQVYVAAAHRGSGVADALLADAEARIRAAGHSRAWLAVVAGNARARRFYERRGWADDGPLIYPAEGPNGPIDVPTHRYVKDVTDSGLNT
jgi:GNAT superfamily N-acetyltransferase